ncbi:Transcriptional regulator, TetR family [Actinokineospora spheciospongiae]|uniref:Transcriptional regulator, TetR family n=1 Tax=Actinokineospora spheciospongiae TaxID=909613 RepID=W7ISV4_9PSEU|nr:TetR/AcrR family transcriptional regulator C-terminal domain-containing protein [Actinokineospora spheciospongiae]EWC59827.1 Transcriptional regulator, TetR family [Actinokineospora spheciospongiae]PWW63141.1 TetR family transcriptional regulator [Actinokineospora spheciospongiae]
MAKDRGAKDRGATRGTADPARSLALLWRTREPSAREGRTELSVARIATAAIEIADTEGIAALTMRRVSEVLGVGTMSPYTYVPGKSELLDLMIDTVYGELPAEAPDEGDWRVRLERVAMDNWDLYRAHPWLAAVESSRPVLGPNLLAKYERELGALLDSGLGDVDLDSVLTLVLGHVRASARAAADIAALESETGMTDQQWWQAHSPWLAGFATAGATPNADRVGTAAGEAHGAAYDPEHALRFGLRRLLDGISVMVEQQRAGVLGDERAASG